ncbi:MAG TPA: ATP-binding cassette domain-containing protein, partial [Gammaproteobacteria bacterium]
MHTDTLLSAEGLCRDYGGRRAVRGLELTVARGEVLGLLGPNGAGKSTTLQMLSGCLQPSAGRVAVAGHDLARAPRAARAALGYLPERPPLYLDLTVDEYLEHCGG